tara:strand:- start:10796 stop:11098 length:303 start_codon:yes stop_codon:yes gene_type:complete
MSFNKKHIPAKKNFLKKEYLKIGHDKFIKKYRKYDAFIVGNYTNSFFINWVIYENKKYVFIVYELCQFLYRIKELGLKGIISNLNYKLKKRIKYVLGSKS